MTLTVHYTAHAYGYPFIEFYGNFIEKFILVFKPGYDMFHAFKDYF